MIYNCVDKHLKLNKIIESFLTIKRHKIRKRIIKMANSKYEYIREYEEATESFLLRSDHQ